MARGFEHEQAQYLVEVDGSAAEVPRVVRDVADLHGDGCPRILGQRFHGEIDEAEIGEAAIELDLQAASRVGFVAEHVEVELHFARIVAGVGRAAHAEQGLSREVRRKYGEIAAAGGVDVDDHASVAAIDLGKREGASRVIDAEVEPHDILGVRKCERSYRIDVEVVDSPVQPVAQRRNYGGIGVVRETVATDAGLGVDGALINTHVVDTQFSG